MFRIDMGLIDQSYNWKSGNWTLLFKKQRLYMIDHNELKVIDLMDDLGMNQLDHLAT